MRSILNEFASSQELEKVSALAVAILSHGSENDIIIGTDGTCLSKLDIQEIFKGRRCQSMAGKPKLFILNASRGCKLPLIFTVVILVEIMQFCRSAVWVNMIPNDSLTPFQ